MSFFFRDKLIIKIILPAMGGSRGGGDRGSGPPG